MKTIKLSVAFSLFTIMLSAQVKQKIETEKLTGYEHNYFKSPTKVLQDGVLFDKNNLISSSIYQDLKAKYKYRKTKYEHELRFIAAFRTRLYYENFEDSYWSLYGNAKYQYSINKKTKLFLNTFVHRMNRKGLDGVQDILINPLGYTQYKANIGMNISPFMNNKTIFDVGYRFKNFDAYGIRNLQYDELGAQLKTTQTFKVNGKAHKFGAKAYYKSRKYITFNASDIDSEGERNWDYLMLKPFYQYPINKDFKVTPSFSYLNRIDKLNNQSSYKQFGPELKIYFRTKSTKLKALVKHQTRNYTSIEARNNDGLIGDKLQYQYADFSLNVDHKLGRSNFFLTANCYSIVRTTNYSDIEARFFRGYSNQYAGLGVKWLL